MSKSLSSLCNHKLNLNSIKNLAIDLANRLQVNIEYGNYGYIKKIDDDTYELVYEFIQEDEIVVKNPKKTLQLMDCLLWAEKFIMNNNNSSNKSIQEIIGLLNSGKEDYIYELTNFNDEYEIVLEIGKNHALIHDVEYMDWHYFANHFIYKTDEPKIKDLNIWRESCLKWVLKLNGSYCIHFSFEDESYIIEKWINVFKETELFANISTKFNAQIVNIPNYLNSKTYLNNIEKPIHLNNLDSYKKYFVAEKNNISIHPYKENYPVLFYDDFIDLTTDFLSENRNLNIHYTSNDLIKSIEKNTNHFNAISYKRKKQKLPDLTNYFKIYSGIIAGVRHYYSVDEFLELAINQPLILEREDKNAFDKKAIAIYAEINSEKTKLGYIAKQDNYMLSKMLDNGFKFKTYLKTINENYFENIYNQNIYSLIVFCPVSK